MAALTIKKIKFPSSSWVYAIILTCQDQLAIWFKDHKGLPSVCCLYPKVNGPVFFNAMSAWPSKGKFVWYVLPYRQPYVIVPPPQPPWQNQCPSITFRSSSAAAFPPGSATATITQPAGTLATDVLLVLLNSESAPGGQTFAPPAGWSLIFPGFFQDGPVTESPPTSAVLYGFWALGSVANLTFTCSDPANSNSGWLCLAFAGVDNTNPVDAVGTASMILGTPNANLTANAVATVTDGALEVIASCDVGIGDTITNPSFNAINNQVNLPAPTGAILYATNPTSPPGNTGAVVLFDDGDFTGSPRVNNILAMPFALRPG